MPDLEEITDTVAEKERSSPPPILRRRRNAHLQSRTETPDSGNHSDYLMMSQQQQHHQQQQTGDTTPSTPIKQLPFSPSQFLNSLSPETSSWPRASTPKGSSPGPLTTPQPSGLRRSQNGRLLSNTSSAIGAEFGTSKALIEAERLRVAVFQTATRRGLQRRLKTPSQS